MRRSWRAASFLALTPSRWRFPYVSGMTPLYEKTVPRLFHPPRTPHTARAAHGIRPTRLVWIEWLEERPASGRDGPDVGRLSGSRRPATSPGEGSIGAAPPNP